jgi:hypothetical protein
MSIFNNGNFAKPFNVSQPQLNSSDRTANLRSKTKYAAAVNLAKNGGVLTKQDGSKYVGPVHTTTATMTSADSYSDLLDVTKGKYLLTPPPSSNLDTSFSPASGDVFYGSFTVTDYAEANIPVTMLGAPGVTANKYVNPNQLVASTTPPPPFNNTGIVVDPEYRMFYGKKTCGMRDYFKNVRIDPSADVRWTDAEGVVHSSRPYNQQQAQRILAHEAQRLRGFQYPARVHLDLDNCESKPSITPVAPDAPVIYISSQTLTSDEPELFTVTVAWPHGFDGGSPITQYTVHTSTGESYTVDPQPCLNSYTLYNIALTTQISVTATNCIPQSTWASGTPAPHCTPMTSPKSNPVNPNPPHLPTITVAFSSGPNPMPYEPGKVITMTITSDNPMPFSVTSSDLDNGLAQLNQPNGGTRDVSLSTTNGYSITLLSGKNPAARTTISVSFMQASGGGYSRGFATATLVILPALPPQIVFKLNGSSATTLTVPYSPSATIPMTISTSNYPVAQSDYQVTITDSDYAQVASGNASIQLLKNPSIPTTVSIMVTQPGTLNYPQGTATKTLTIASAPPPTITIGLIGLTSSTVQYEAGKTIALSITSTSNPPLTPQSEYTVTSSNTNLVQISSDNTSIQLLPNANPSAPTTVTITVIQPATQYYPSGTATKMLTITPAPPPTITLTLNPASPVSYEPGKSIALTIASTNPTPPPPPIVASSGKVTFQSSSGILIVSSTDYNNYAVGQVLTANPGTGTFGGATVTVTGKYINPLLLETIYFIDVSVVGGTPITGDLTSVMASFPKYTVTSNSGLVQINPPLSGDSNYTLVVGSPNPSQNAPVTITITVVQSESGSFGRGTATKTLTITPAPPPTITVTLNPTTVPYESGKKIQLTITSTSNPQPQLSAYTVNSSNTNLTRIIATTTGGDTIVSYFVELIENPSAPSQQVTITVIQPATQYYPSGTGTATLIINPVPTITLTLNPALPVTYEPGKSIGLTITSSNPPPAPILASAGAIYFLLSSGDASTGTLNVPSSDYNNYAVGQVLTATAVSGSGTFGGATVTVTNTSILPQGIAFAAFIISVSIVGGSPASGNVSNVMASILYTISLSPPSMAQITPPSSGSSNYTLVLASNTYPTQDTPVAITVTQAAGGGFAQGTANTTLTIQPMQMTQKNFIGWLPQGLTPKQPDFMTQEIVITTANNIYNVPNTNTQCNNGSSPINSNVMHLSLGQQLNVGTVYIGALSSTQSLTFRITHTDGSTDIYNKTFSAGNVPTSGIFNFTLDFTLSYPYATDSYMLMWSSDYGTNFTLNCTGTDRSNWCGSVGTATTGTPFYVMGFNTGGNYTLSRYNQGATSLTTLLTGTGSITSINEQLITNSAMSGGGRNLIVCGNFPSATTSTTPSTTTRVNNIFQYNVETQTVIPLQCATTTATTYPVGTNGQVWGCEVDTVNNRVWVWGDFTGCGTLASGGDAGVAALGVNLATGADFVTSANWTNPVSWQGCAAYLGVHAAKLGGASTGYSLFCYKLQDYNGGLQAPTSNPQTGVVRQAGTTWGRGTYLNGSNISGTVLSIYQFSSAAAGNWFIFAGTYTQATYDGTNATTAYGVSIMDATKSLTLGGVYGAALQPTMKNTDATVWKNGGYPTYPVRIALLSNNYLCITTSGYPVGSIMTYDFNNIASNTVAPTKWGGFTAPYSANYIGGTDPNSVKLITNLNANPFYYSQTFNMVAPMFSTTFIPDWTTIATGNPHVFTTTTPMTLSLQQSITITYSATDYITGTITAISGTRDITRDINAISGTQITMTITQFAHVGTSNAYSVGVITLTPISWTISPSMSFGSVQFGGNIYIGTGPANVIPAPTNSDSSIITYSAELVAPSNLQPCVSVTQSQGSTSAYLTLSRPDPLGSLAEYNIIATQYGKTASIRIKFSETHRVLTGFVLVVQVMNV